MRAAVLGLGLMGGSLARDLAALGAEVRGHDRDPAASRAALAAGVIRGEIPPSLEGLEEAELVVIAAPVRESVSLLEALAPRLSPGSVVTDLGSTKRSIERAATRAGVADRFVGSHPLAGDHRSGWAASREGLFAGARVYLCPTALTSPGALERVTELWLRLGARPEAIGAEEHDRRLAWTSHLPQAASSALALALAGAGHGPGSLGPGGRDATRLAGSSPEVWSSICLDNADAIESAVGGLLEELAGLREALRGRDARALESFFAEARAWSGGEPALAPKEQSDPSRIP